MQYLTDKETLKLREVEIEDLLKQIKVNDFKIASLRAALQDCVDEIEMHDHPCVIAALAVLEKTK